MKLQNLRLCFYATGSGFTEDQDTHQPWAEKEWARPWDKGSRHCYETYHCSAVLEVPMPNPSELIEAAMRTFVPFFWLYY